MWKWPRRGQTSLPSSWPILGHIDLSDLKNDIENGKRLDKQMVDK